VDIGGTVEDRRYAVTVGARLRAIRAQQRLSLQDVEARSDEEFKASVLGAYERGERAISVARLQRLAAFYGVPVDRLLPADSDRQFGRRPGDVAPDEVALPAAQLLSPLRIDLVALEALASEPADLLRRFLRTIQVQRGDFNGQVLTVRGADHVAMGCILDVPPEAAAARLREMGLVFEPSAP
jgi:transcriptional regulator with XRE-family HTH domain